MRTLAPNPLGGVNSKQPDKELFDKAMIAMKKGHFDVCRLDLQTMLNTYPESEFRMRAKLAVGDSWFKEGGTSRPHPGRSRIHLDIDLSQFPQDEILPKLDVPGVQGHYKEVSDLTQKRKLTLSQVGKQYGIGPLREFCGSGADVADRLQEWFEAGACDGFMVQMPYLPGGIEDFARLVVPELQQRGLFRREYEGVTLRDHLGLTRPKA